MYQKHNRLIVACLLAAILIGSLGWKAPSTTHQDQLNRALIAAIKHNDPDKALVLLVQGADPNARDVPTQNLSPWKAKQRGKHPTKRVAPTAFLIAVQGQAGEGVVKENVPMVKALLDKGADVNASNEQDTTALMSAVAYGHLQTVKLLIERGAKVNLRDKPFYLDIGDRGRIVHALQSGRTALMYASEIENLAIMKLLLDHGANANDADLQHHSLLMAAAGSGNIQKVRLLLDKGADVNAEDDLGYTSLITAANSVYLDILRLLLQRGAQVNARNAEGGTALMEAAQYGGAEAIKLLLAAGAQVNVKRQDGKTALMLAQDNPKAVSLLKQAGAKE